MVFLPPLVPQNAADWRALLGALIGAGFTDIVLDGSRMAHVDSLGLAEIVRSYTVLARSNGTLRLNRMSKAARDLLEVTRLVTIFAVDDVDYSRLPRVEVAADDLSQIATPRA